MIEYKNVSKNFHGRCVLDNVSFQVKPGECIALLGQSGSGKSTLVRMLVGLSPASSGTIEVDGEKVNRSTRKKLCRKFGYVIQSGGLFPHLSARENVAIAIDPKTPKNQVDEKIIQSASLCHFHLEKLSNYPGELSGGERQRVALMRALINDPGYIILDEPLGALDPITRTNLQEELKELFNSLNKSVIIVTHDLAEAEYFAHRIVLLKSGRVVQVGTFDQLSNKPASPFVTEFINAQRVL